MRSSFVRLAFTISLVFLCAIPATAAVQSAVALLAGSGLSGFSDGPAANATFALPAAVAVSVDGDIVVADAGAQRIRLIHDGVVTTLAGGGSMQASGGDWPVAGGFANGPRQDARFSRPSGVAIGRDGTVYVADSANHCIRTIKDAVVSTFAGDCALRVTPVDGTKVSARFGYVRQIALDGDGNLFVADYGTGVRRVARDGSVTTLPLPAGAKSTIVGVAVWGTGASQRVFAADREGLIVIDTATGKSVKHADTAEGHRRFGVPDALAALGPREVAFTDAHNHQIRIFRDETPTGAAPGSTTWEITAPADGEFRGGGYIEGSASKALFDSPRGIAVAPNGNIVICDAGNRRIRVLRGFDARIPAEGAEKVARSSIVVTGGSYVFYDTVWERSLPGMLEALVPSGNRVAAARYRDGSADSMRAALAAGLATRPATLVWQVTAEDIGFERTVSASALHSLAAAVMRNARANRVRLMFVTIPVLPPALGPPDTLRDTLARYARLREAVAIPGADVLDTAGALRDDAASPAHVALFGSVDPHLTPEGNRFVAGLVAAALNSRSKR